MKYPLLGIWVVILFFLFLLAVTAQFLWDFKKPTVKYRKTMEKGMEFLEGWGKSERPERDDY